MIRRNFRGSCFPR